MNDMWSYLANLGVSLDHAPMASLEKVVAVLQEARRVGRTVFVFGNGGSAATAAHIVCDFAKNTRRRGAPLLRIVGLIDNLPILTAYANDEGYEQIFAQQLENLIRPRDVVLGISTSGNSPNVLAGVRVARKHQATTIGFTALDGGQLAELVDIEVRAPTTRVDMAEDLHLVYEHMITARLKDADGEDSLQWTLARADRLRSADPVGADGAMPGNAAAGSGAPETPSTPGLLQGLLLVAADCVGASSGSMILLDDGGKQLACVLFYDGSVVQPAGDGVSESLERGLAGWVLQNRQPALIHNTHEDPRWLRLGWEGSGTPSRSALSVPLGGAGGVRGVLTLANPGVDRFTEQDLELVSALASHSRGLRIDQDSLVGD